MMRLSRNIDDLSYFTGELRSYIRESHPDFGDDEFVRNRGEAALDEYCTAVQEGANHLEATERANAVLYRGLRFSRFDTIYSIVMEWFPEIDESQRTEISMAVLLPSADIFSTYDPGDDFEATPLFKDCQWELMGLIQTYLEEHGIQ